MKSIRRIIHGSGLRVVNLGATVAVGLFLMPFLVHHLGDTVYGYWALVGSILGYYGILDFGIVSAVQFYVAKALGENDGEGANRTISVSFFLFAAIGAVILFVTVLSSLLVHRFVTDPEQAAMLRDVLLIMGAGFAVGFPGRAFLGALSAHLRWDLLSIIGLAGLSARTALIVVAIEAHGGLVAMASVMVVTDVITFTVYYLVLRRIHRPVRLSAAYINFRTLKQILTYSSFSLVVKVSYQLRFYIDIWVIGAFLSVGIVTHYAIGSRLALSFMDLMICLIGLLHPWFSILLGSKDYDGIRRILKFGTKVSASAAAIVAMLLIVYGRLFIHAWMGGSYGDAYWPLVLLVSGVFFEVSQQPSTSFLFGVSLNRFLALISFLEAIANVALSLYWVHVYGMIGVALGTAVPSLIVRLFIQPAYVCRKSGIAIGEYYAQLLGRASFAGIIGVLGPWLLLFQWISWPNLFAIIPLVAGQAVIATAVVYFLAFDAGERGQINDALLSALRVNDAVAVTGKTELGQLT